MKKWYIPEFPYMFQFTFFLPVLDSAIEAQLRAIADQQR